MAGQTQPSTPAPPAVTYSVIVPTYNERENVAVLAWLLIKALAGVPAASFELVVVDDSSPDGTQEVVQQLQAALGDRLAIQLVARPAKLGLGSAYAAGLCVARGDFVVLMDADLSHLPAYLPAFIEKQRRTGCDVVSSTRYAHGGGVAGWNWARKLTSRGANLLASFLLQARASDLTGAYRMYRRTCLVQLLADTRSRGYAFQMEVRCRKGGCGSLAQPFSRQMAGYCKRRRAEDGRGSEDQSWGMQQLRCIRGPTPPLSLSSFNASSPLPFPLTKHPLPKARPLPVTHRTHYAATT